MSLSKIIVNNTLIIGVDDEPISKSENLIRSGSVYRFENISETERLILDNQNSQYLKFSIVGKCMYGESELASYSNYSVTELIPVKLGDSFYLDANGLNAAACYSLYSDEHTYTRYGINNFKGIITIPEGISYIRFGKCEDSTRYILYLRNKEFSNVVRRVDEISAEVAYIEYKEVDLIGPGGYTFKYVSIGDTYDEQYIAAEYSKRLKVSLLTGQKIIARTYATAVEAGHFDGYLITDENNIVIEKVMSGNGIFNSLDVPIIYTASQNVNVYLNCYEGYEDQFSVIAEGFIINKLDMSSMFIPAERTIDNLNVTKGYYLDWNGNEQILAQACYTDYISLTGGDSVTITNCNIFAYLYCYYDNNKNFLGEINGDNQRHEEYTFIVPNTARYIRVNLQFSDNLTLVVNSQAEKTILNNRVLVDSNNIIGLKTEILNEIEQSHINTDNTVYGHKLSKPYPISSSGIWLAFGDSITAGVISNSSYSQGNITDGSGNKYKYIQVLTNKLGINLNNKSVSGATATDCTSMSRSYLLNIIQQAATQSITPSIISVAIGINDFMVNNDSLGTISDIVSQQQVQTSFYGCLNAELQLIKTSWPNVPIIVISPIPFYGNTSSYSNKLDAFRKAVHDVAIINDCSVVDGFLLAFPEKNSIMSNILMGDNLHPSSLGHKMMGENIASIIE